MWCFYNFKQQTNKSPDNSVKNVHAISKNKSFLIINNCTRLPNSLCVLLKIYNHHYVKMQIKIVKEKNYCNYFPPNTHVYK